MKLLILIHSLGSGGAERVTANLASHFAERGWEITVVTMAPESQDFYTLHPAVRRIALDMANMSGNPLIGLWRNLRRLAHLRSILRRADPDIALGMMTTANILLAYATWGLPRPCRIGSERVHPPQFPLGGRWEALRRHAYGKLAAMTAMTRESARWLETHTSARSVSVIPNAVLWPLPVLEPRLSPDAQCPPGRRVLLAVGRLERQKGFDFLIEAFSMLAPTHTDWDLVILGEGMQRAALHAQKKLAGLEGRVYLPGKVGNVGEWYERADIYVMSSRFEGFPNTLVEAQAHGLPAVSFDCDSGPRDILRDQVDGLLVPPGDISALAAALNRLMGDAELIKRFAARAIEVRERYSMERITGLWQALFEELVDDRARSRSRQG